MTLRRAASLALCFLLGAGHLSARDLPTPPVFPVVMSGVRTRVWSTFGLNADCTSTGNITVRLAQEPKNGSVEIVRELGHTEYGKDNQQYKCNEKASEITGIYYMSRGGFKGKDRFTTETFFPSGDYRKTSFTVDVR